MVNSNPTKKTMKTSTTTIANTASWCCAIVVVALIMLSCSFEVLEKEQDYYSLITTADDDDTVSLGGNHQLFMSNPRRPCDEIYVVGEGETLHTISDKCGDPFIVEKNPHIHDPDDVFPGLVIKITPSLL
ncbi:hypothetical protein LOK49_LG03G02415 [Camellia lanceoleosa]|uniref:Uncharacterized protein n=1 Tax=Camellia lanceoleosa TaxID=1840588 RepID=A0ACC0IDX1_9ERIC|nr:hypothetical protein LOK49_LG03G02415 [Camellia lanceoleosa]